MEKDKKIPVYLTGNGGQSYHDMEPKDAKKLENILDEGTNNKTFKFTDGKTNNKIIVVLDKLFVMEIGSKKGVTIINKVVRRTLLVSVLVRGCVGVQKTDFPTNHLTDQQLHS